MSHGLALGVAYTWSKLLTTNPQDRALISYDAYNLKQSYGLSTLNTPQIVSINYMYEEPFFKNQRGLGWVLGGWELSGIVSIQSGQSFSVTQDNDPWALVTTTSSTLSCTIGPSQPTCPLYPGGIGLPFANPGVRANQSGSSHGPKTLTEFFNTAAFSDAIGQFGNAAPGSVLGPGFQRWDTSLFKNVRFGERVNLQLRLEAFNTFNHTSPNSVVTDRDSSSFGAVNGYHIPRKLKIGVKITF
jgi:hypothetical protein